MLLYHIIVYITYVFSLVYDIVNVEGTLTKGYGGRFKFLTFWCLCIQTAYFGLCVINDLCGSNVRPTGKDTKVSSLQKFRDFFLAAIVFPVGIFVVSTFWSIYAVDRELVYPKALDKIIPQWLNHIMHTTVLPFLLVEKYLVYHQYPSRKSGITAMLAFAATYLVWILWIAYYADIWVYPILRVLLPHQRAVFIIAMLFLFISLYILGESINKFFWGKERSAVQASQVKNSQKVK